MARLKAPGGADVRAGLLESERYMLSVMESVGADVNAARYRRGLEALERGEPVVVHHGWQIGLPPNEEGPWLVNGDGSVTRIGWHDHPDVPRV